MQTEMSRGPLAEDKHSRKETVGGVAAFGRPPPFFFLPWSSSAFPLAFLSAFHRGSMVNQYYFSDAYANTHLNANANSKHAKSGSLFCRDV